MPCLWEQFRFCHKTSQPMNKRLEVFEVYLEYIGKTKIHNLIFS